MVAAIGILYPDSMNTEEYRASTMRSGQIAAREISRRLDLE